MIFLGWDHQRRCTRCNRPRHSRHLDKLRRRVCRRVRPSRTCRSITWRGEWSWTSGGTLTSTGPTPVGIANNLTWNPDIIPGYDTGGSDSMWHNHLGTIHYPNFGADFDNIALVSGVIARPPIANMSARVFNLRATHRTPSSPAPMTDGLAAWAHGLSEVWMLVTTSTPAPPSSAPTTTPLQVCSGDVAVADDRHIRGAWAQSFELNGQATALQHCDIILDIIDGDVSINVDPCRDCRNGNSYAACGTGLKKTPRLLVRHDLC